MARNGDLWPYSTRATEARGGRYKRLKKVTCQRRRATLPVMRGYLTKKTGIVKYKKQGYNSSTSMQLMRGACAQEISAHRLSGRNRLKTTGRKTLKRVVPKWEEDAHPMPPLGKLLDPEALKIMFGRAAAFFTKELKDYQFLVPMRALRLAAGS